MSSTLLISVRFHDGRYHGVPEWPPSPARVFQALVAAAARGGAMPDDAKTALEWFENLKAPVIAAPVVREAKGFTNFVPSNDLDAVGGDLKRIGEIRAGKTIRPRLFDVETPLLYAWTLDETDGARPKAEKICTIAEDLYQLGRGVDMAWAVGEILSAEELGERLAAHAGPVHRPSNGAGGVALACPQERSLASLIDRHKKTRERFTTLTEPNPKKPDQKKAVGQLFSQPPKPRFRQVAYDCPPHHSLFDLSGGRAPWPFTETVELVALVRDCATARLATALPDRAAEIQRIFVGLNATDADKVQRIRIIPLPSIGHAHADRAIRRVMIEIPPNCPIPVGDIEWAFSGLTPTVDNQTGEVLLELVPAASRKMLEYYGIDNNDSARVWRTVTPAALPESAARRRIDPKRLREEAKGGSERANEETRAAAAVVQALRHAGVATPVEAIRMQREPFEVKGARAEEFAAPPRFPKERLWHVEVTFAAPQNGLLIVGDGRYLGLGLMAPRKNAYRDAFVFEIAGPDRPPVGREVEFIRAVRRALMALDRDHGGGSASLLFSGHENDGSPDRRSGNHRHLFLAAAGDGETLTRLYVFSPQCADRRAKLSLQEKHRFEAVVSQLETVRAGRLGVINLKGRMGPLEHDPAVAKARIWTSATSYSPTRHGKKKSEIESALIRDVCEECARRGLPVPNVTMRDVVIGPRSGITAKLEMAFPAAVKGPIILGRGAHFGLGLFKAVTTA